MDTASLKRNERRRGGARLWSRLLALHEETFSDAGRARLKHFVVWASLVGLFTHLGLILLGRVLARHALPAAHLVTSAAGTHYLAAVSTPFSFILFYEVMTLIAALPA